MPTTLACPEENELLALAMGEPGLAEVAAHVDGCASCRTKLGQLQAEVAILRANQSEISLSPSTSPPAASEATSGPAATCGEVDQPGATASWELDDTAGDRAALPPTETVDDDAASGSDEPPLPASIGKYLVVGQFPPTGQAEVFRVFHPQFQQERVLKLAKEPVGADGRSEIIEEGKILSELEHPHLVRVYDLDFLGDRPYLVMEYIRGRNLDQLASEGRITPRLAATLVAKVASAAALAHSRGVVHRDIKPKNILVDEAGEPRLIDFGMARLRTAWSVDGKESDGGTFAFMAPEQARIESPEDRQKVGPRSDVFALGAVLFFLLTGRAPFHGQTWREAWDRARRCDYEAGALNDRKIPAGLRRICLKAMAADPAERYDTAEEMRQVLARFPGRPVLLAGAALLLLVAAPVAVVDLRGFLLRSSHHAQPLSSLSPRPANSKPMAMATGPQTLVKVDRQGTPLELPDAVPLRTGDLVWIECGIPSGWGASVFWFDSEGRLTELGPSGRQRDRASDRISFPVDGATTLVGSAGTEFIFVCARPSSPPQLSEVSSLFPGDRLWHGLPDRELIVLDRDRVTIKSPSRPDHAIRGAGPLQASAARELVKTLENLRVALADKFEFVAGVSFPHRDPSSKPDPSTNPVK